MSDLYLFFFIALIGLVVISAGSIILMTRKDTVPHHEIHKKVELLEKEVEALKNRN
ncbi:hypothetical protein [Fictibacillus enclensis]|uniref:hypothetical protein n=1 Tax=Fictibacillus enclensis TaxID=1017270 RepID=UPI0024C06B4C|nr:hypothetical protein [Fictibacillus enclensis]WHY71434.1 hypothetical protein QNH15_20875 [Fictibacillus enclensis]